ncbi:MAG: hypothetical protein R3288_04700 [Woeseiaceae bacterium]|nr:hypothetical protein [Woeseiaceae bacterium]
MNALFFEPSLPLRLGYAVVAGVLSSVLLVNGWRVETVLDPWIGYPALLPAGFVIAALVFAPSIPARRATRVRVALLASAGAVLLLVLTEAHEAYGYIFGGWDTAVLTAGYLLTMAAMLAVIADIRFNWRLFAGAAAASALTNVAVVHGPQCSLFEQCSNFQQHLSAGLMFGVWTTSMSLALHWGRSRSAQKRD